MTCRVKTACGPMSFAIAVTIAGSALRSSARRGTPAPPGSGRAKSATKSIASVAEPPLPSASTVPPPLERPAQRAGRPAQRLARLAHGLLAQASISRAFMSTESRTSASTPARSRLALVQERIEEARCACVVAGRARAPAEQAAVLEEHVRELPDDVVDGLDQLLAHVRVDRRRLDHPSAPSGANASVRLPRDRAAASAAARPGRVGLLAEGEHDVVGAREQRDLLRQ